MPLESAASCILAPLFNWSWEEAFPVSISLPSKSVALPVIVEASIVKLPLAVTVPTAGAAAIPNGKFAATISAISDCTENRCTFISP